MSLKVVSLTRYEKPSYPTRGILDEHPELLKLVPRRWRGNAAVVAALTGLCLLMSTHRSHAADTPSEKPSCRVAPIFQHGDGRGSFGCIATNPPVVLSEEEARELITEEAKKAGLFFAPDSLAYPQVVAPPKRRTSPPDSIPPFTFDGTDKHLNVSYEFMSREDSATWRLTERPRVSNVTTRDDATGKMKTTLVGDWSFSSVYTENPLKYATSLRERLVTAEVPGSSVVFYDPITVPSLAPLSGGDIKSYQADMDKHREDAKNTSKEQLREQVRDFIKWLKAQGVI